MIGSGTGRRCARYVRVRVWIVALAAAASIAAGCSKKGDLAKTEKPKGPAAAVVNGETITVPELDQRVDLMIKSGQGPQPTQAGQADPMPGFRKVVLDQLIDEKLMIQEAGRLGVTPPDSEVVRAVEQFKSTFPSEQAYQAELAKYQTNAEMVEQNLRNELTYRAFVRKVIEPKVVVDSADVRTFYETHQTDFIAPEEMVHARHILIRADSTTAPEARAQARKRAEEIRAMAVAPKADFATLASSHSEDAASRVNGGDIGYFGRGQMDFSFTDAAFRLKPGGVSPVIESRFGYHIIKVEAKRKPGLVPLPEVYEQVYTYLLQEKVRNLLQAELTGLRGKAKIEVKIEEPSTAEKAG